MKVFSRRSSRHEYWLSIAFILLVTVLLAVFLPEETSVGNGLIIGWVLVWVWRLHDIGLRGWWSLIPILGSIAILLGFVAFGGFKVLLALGGDPIVLADPTFPYELYALIMLVACMLLQMGFTLWLGLKQGDPGPNRFGEPPNW